MVDFRFYAITDRKKTNESLFFTLLEEAISLGVRAIQIREKDLSSKELFEFCHKAQTQAGTRDVRLFVNDRCDIADALDLAGVHLTKKSIPVEYARKIVGPEKLIGVSTHSVESAILAETSGADFIVTGPVAETNSKPAGHAVMKLEEFKFICSQVRIPVFALGGVTPENTKTFLEAGAFGVAGISLWMQPKDMPARLEKLKLMLQSL